MLVWFLPPLLRGLLLPSICSKYLGRQTWSSRNEQRRTLIGGVLVERKKMVLPPRQRGQACRGTSQSKPCPTPQLRLSAGHDGCVKVFIKENLQACTYVNALLYAHCAGFASASLLPTYILRSYQYGVASKHSVYKQCTSINILSRYWRNIVL